MKRVKPSSLQDIMRIAKEAQSSCETDLTDLIAERVTRSAEEIYKANVRNHSEYHRDITSMLDDIFTSRIIGYPSMLLLLACVFWITLLGAIGLLPFSSGFCFH